MSLVVQSSSWSARQWRALCRSVPEPVSAFFRGPVGVVRIADTGAVTSRIRSWRPVHLIVSSALVLQRRIVLPKSSRADLRHLVDLFIGQETPFDPTEVLAAAVEHVGAPGDQNIAYQLTLLPRAVVARALTQVRIGTGGIVRISLDHGEDGILETKLVFSLLPQRRFSSWLIALPIAALLAVAILGAGRDLSARRAGLAMLQAQIETEAETARSLAAELAARRQVSSGLSAALALIAATPSAFATLQAVRQVLPHDTEITRIDLHGDELRLAVRSANILEDVQLLGSSSEKWMSSVEGAITADPRAGGEFATILLRTPGAAKS